MKIITWNCNMAFRKKAELILSHNPDIIIIPECEEPEKIFRHPVSQKPTSYLWFGNNKHKGLGIFSYNGYTLKRRRNHNPEFRTIVPITVSKDLQRFTLYAIWAYNPDDPDGQYVTQIWKAIHFYRKYLKKTGTILAGDFNSNTIWDKKRRAGNHSNVVKFLEKKGIHSTYHLFHKQNQGQEQHPTFYLYRHQNKPYHMDYCFVSADLADRLQSVEIGVFKDWKHYSDHVPVIVTFTAD
jgi:exodeoxyribonuclease-3